MQEVRIIVKVESRILGKKVRKGQKSWLTSWL